MMDDAALAELAADIKANGLRDPIWRHPDGRIIDGRNRWLACQKAGVECRHRTYERGDETIVPYVVSYNLHRRHLTTAVRAAIAADIANLPQGARTDLSPIDGMSQPAAAKLLNVSPKSVERAAALKRADPVLHEKVKTGEVTAGKARAAIKKVATKKKPRPTFAARPDDVNSLSLWLRNGPRVLNNAFPTPADAVAKAAEYGVAIDLRELEQTTQFLAAMMANLLASESRRDSEQQRALDVADLSDLPDRVCLQVNQLKSVADKIDPASLHERCSIQNYNNLSAALSRVTEFLSALHEQHLAHGDERKNAAMEARRDRQRRQFSSDTRR
jgi:hypothetical protein